MLNLYYPIYIEYFRIEYGLYNANKPDADAEDEFSFNDS